jgi:hypothetical protein
LWDRIEQNTRRSRRKAQRKTFSNWILSSAAILLGFIVAFTTIKAAMYNDYEPELMSLTLDTKVHSLYNHDKNVALMEAYKKLSFSKNQL